KTLKSLNNSAGAPHTMRLVQLKKGEIRRVAIVEEPHLRLISTYLSIYELAHSAITASTSLSDCARKRATDELLNYDPIYSGHSEWQVITPIDHPDEPACCMVSGTGLTHTRQRPQSANHA